ALAWILHVVVEHRRWSRILQVQTEAHNKVLDRLGTGDAMLAYMQTESGKRLLEAAPIAVALPSSPSGTPMARVLAPLQLGLVVSAVVSWFLARHFGLLPAGNGAALDARER